MADPLKRKPKKVPKSPQDLFQRDTTEYLKQMELFKPGETFPIKKAQLRLNHEVNA